MFIEPPDALLYTVLMRVNKFIATASGLSRRTADVAISDGRVLVNGQRPVLGQAVGVNDVVTLDGRDLSTPPKPITIMLNKPVGYVASRDGQGSRTVYDLLPNDYHALKPVGRLDKDSSGLLLLTNDGELANRLTHPSFGKQKIYEASLDKPLSDSDRRQIEHGVRVEDYTSRLQLSPLSGGNWRVTMSEGKNRQIRRTFAALNYTVTKLHRTDFGEYHLDTLASGSIRLIKN